MDEDGDGKINDEEFKKYEEACAKAIEQILALTLNAGVIAALLVSCIYSTSMTDPVISQKTRDYFGSDCYLLRVLYLVVVNLIVGLGILEIFLSTIIHVVLTSWLQDQDSQIWWVGQHRMVYLGVAVAIPLLMLIGFAIFPVLAALCSSPLAGFIALIQIACLLVALVFMVRMQVDARYRQLVTASHLVGEPPPEQLSLLANLCSWCVTK